MQARSGVSVICLDEGNKVRVVGVVVLHKNSLVLKPDDCDPIAIILCEGSDAETKCRTRTRLVARRCGLAPVNGMDRPSLMSDCSKCIIIGKLTRCFVLKQRRLGHDRV